MHELIRRNRERLQALSPRQIWVEAVVNAVTVGIVSFYFSRSLRHTLGTVVVFLILTLSSTYWLRQSPDPALRRAARRRKRREARTSRD